MDPFSPFAILVLVTLAVVSAAVLTKIFGPPPLQGRFATIDGLRGYLAFFVFVHHSAVWYQYLHGGEWALPPSLLYTHLGKSGVSVFFMITGFLFYLKILDGARRPIDWTRLYVSRILRLTPLYLFAMLCLFIIVLILSDGVRRTTLSDVLLQIFRWLTFTISGARDINGIEQTFIIVAGVTWSLRFEWFFYMSLPLLALTAGIRPPRTYLLVSIAAAVGTALILAPAMRVLLLPFLSGIATARLTKHPGFCSFAKGPAATILVVLCTTSCVTFFAEPEKPLPLVLISLSFALIACGNTLLGALTHAYSRTLGELAYSIYLLHGLSLFTAFRFFVGFDRAQHFSPLQHWLTVGAVTPILIAVCFATYKLIEAPAMHSVPALTAWLRSFIRVSPPKSA